jgi:hypothetical protein
MSQNANQQPVKEFKIAGLQVAVWRSSVVVDGRTIPSYSIRIQKRYKKRDSADWANTDYLYPSDIPRLMLLLSETYKYVSGVRIGGQDTADVSFDPATLDE